jgi:hypothetical protein
VSDPSLAEVLEQLTQEVRGLREQADEHRRHLARVLETTRLLHDNDRWYREGLRAAREATDYAEAYDSPEPLVSIVVPTWTNAEALRDVALPAALAQTYQQFEVVIVGDCAPPDVEAVATGTGDARVRFHNLTIRGPYSDDPRQGWLASGTPAYNAGAALARGAWIAPMSDDDPWTPDHLERLLEKARTDRLEFVFGAIRMHWPDGRVEKLGRYPPEHGQIGLQAALLHRALRLFELEFGDALFDAPNDWGTIRRMMRAGARMGYVDEIVVDYFPSVRSPAHAVTATVEPGLASSAVTDEDLYATPPADVDAADCIFYHRMEIPGHGVVGGQWDLRGREDEYLGGVPLDGRRVLEIGPASGFLTFAMEARGASVVGIDLPEESRWDVVPNPRLDPAAVANWLGQVRRMKNGFWFAHRRHDSAARVHYGNAYDLPQELGHFDVAVMAAVLLHLRDPLAVVAQCARLSDRIVITDMHVPELAGRPVQQLVPSVDAPQWDTWWRFSPELFVQFLDVLGFATQSLTFHEQVHLSGEAQHPMAMMTIVADRT